MVKVKMSLKDLSLDIIDECECTIGQSRQITAFRQYVLNALRLRVAKTIEKLEKEKINKANPKFAEELAEALMILSNNQFDWESSLVENGTIINVYKYKGEDE